MRQARLFWCGAVAPDEGDLEDPGVVAQGVVRAQSKAGATRAFERWLLANDLIEGLPQERFRIDVFLTDIIADTTRGGK